MPGKFNREKSVPARVRDIVSTDPNWPRPGKGPGAGPVGRECKDGHTTPDYCDCAGAGAPPYSASNR